MTSRQLIHTLLAATALASMSAAAAAANCGSRQTEYLVDWTSFADIDADPTGRPTRAYAFPIDKKTTNHPVNRVQVDLQYAGEVRRFSFDHPKVVDNHGLPGGALEIRQNLLQPYEMTETRILFDQQVSNLTIELDKVDDNAQFGRSFHDRVSILARGSRTGIIAPDVEIRDLADPDERAILAYEKAKGFGGANIYPIVTTGLGLEGYAAYKTSFDKDVNHLAIRLTSMTSESSSYATSQNPAPQDLKVGRVTFCLDK